MLMYRPRFSRGIATFGGYDVTMHNEMTSMLPFPTPLHFAVPDHYVLAMSIKSRIPAEITYVLDLLSVNSYLGRLQFISGSPDLINSLVRFAGDAILELFPHAQTTRSDQTEKPLVGYEALFAMEMADYNMPFQPIAEPTLPRIQILCNQIYTIGLILRNASFDTENHTILARHPGVIEFLLLIVDLTQLLDNYGNDDDDDDDDDVTDPDQAKGSGQSLTNGHHQHHRVPFALLRVLDNRKNALTTLSNMGHLIISPSNKSTTLILNILSDFFIHFETAYAYTALDALAKFLISTDNHETITAYPHITDLIDRLSQLFLSSQIALFLKPSSFVLLEDVDVAKYELGAKCLLAILRICGEVASQHVVDIPGLISIFVRLACAPIVPDPTLAASASSQGHSTASTTSHPPTIANSRAHSFYRPLSHHAMMILVELARSCTQSYPLTGYEHWFLTVAVSGERVDDTLAELASEILAELS
eukprot:jgi/Hompol1/349/HPOL_005291-RA